MTSNRPPRARHVRVLATLGPASNSVERIRALYEAGADAFRVNMSHGDDASRLKLIETVRGLESELGRPMTILADLQGPKLRVGRFAEDRVELRAGQRFRLDSDETPGDAERVRLPHPEILAVLSPGHRLLLDDGRLVLKVTAAGEGWVETEVQVPGALSNNKGLNVPDAVVPLPALTAKDRHDLSLALEAGVDWVALSFVQRADDVAEAKKLIGGRALLMAKIEKPAAMDDLEAIVELADAIMVARGDLGVELPPQEVPGAQKRMVAAARRAGKPVVVATQMLESMILSPSPTRAEVSDVANAIYDGVDAVMLSAESAAGQWPVQAVAMMDAIAREVERDSAYEGQIGFVETIPEPTTADALCAAARGIQKTVDAVAVVCFTTSGSTARRIARERIPAGLLVMTPKLATARRLGLTWGVHAVHTRDITDFEGMVAKSKRMAIRHHVAEAGDRLVVMAGVPFGVPGSTNVLHVVRLVGDELERHRR
ncbi:pyruvate kinase [Sandaracinobacteroides sayramensis]|uniref:pyruvate kinase n=1 Tax=Sandaracinobacteroides sayramensis TaxID=2913411 RepID=UPI0021034E24|nr:pyruvate kinase [Sandaracinobacteroides sayramensis]